MLVFYSSPNRLKHPAKTEPLICACSSQNLYFITAINLFSYLSNQIINSGGKVCLIQFSILEFHSIPGTELTFQNCRMNYTIISTIKIIMMNK